MPFHLHTFSRDTSQRLLRPTGHLSTHYYCHQYLSNPHLHYNYAKLFQNHAWIIQNKACKNLMKETRRWNSSSTTAATRFHRSTWCTGLLFPFQWLIVKLNGLQEWGRQIKARGELPQRKGWLKTWTREMRSHHPSATVISSSASPSTPPSSQTSSSMPPTKNLGHSVYRVAGERYRASAHPIVLCHGLFGYDAINITNKIQIQYWTGIAEALQAMGCTVYVARVGSVASVRDRALDLQAFLERTVGSGPVNLIAHSMGGLDARYAISHLPSNRLDIRSLTTIATPHRGSPFMDWCREFFGVGYLQDYVARQDEDVVSAVVRSSSPSVIPARVAAIHQQADMSKLSDKDLASFTDQFQGKDARILTALLQLYYSPHGLKGKMASLTSTHRSVLRPLFASFDAPAFSNLTREYCHTFNAITPDSPDVHYASYAAAIDSPRLPALAFAHQIVMREEGRNDGFVSLQSARWGQFEGTVECDHWELIPPKMRGGRRSGDVSSSLSSSFDAISFYLGVVTRLHDKGL